MRRFDCAVFAAAPLLPCSASAFGFDCLIEVRQQPDIPGPVEAAVESVQFQIPSGTRYRARFD